MIYTLQIGSDTIVNTFGLTRSRSVGILTSIRYERIRTHGSRESERGERERYRPSGLVDELEESMTSVSVAVWQ